MPRKATPTTVESRLLFQEDPDDPRHGTTNGYNNLRCRCRRCRDAWARQFAIWRKERRRRIPPHTEGSSSYYVNWGCRCQPCTDAYGAATRRWKRNARRRRAEKGVQSRGGRIKSDA